LEYIPLFGSQTEPVILAAGALRLRGDLLPLRGGGGGGRLFLCWFAKFLRVLSLINGQSSLMIG